MLRHLTTVLFSFVVPALSFVTSYASGTPCVPDCQQSTYNGPFIQVLQLSPTCFIQVTYWCQLACVVNVDIAITRVSILSMPGCNFYNTSAFLESISRALLVRTTGTLRQDMGITQWRVTSAWCWRNATVNDSSDTLMVPCRGEGSCLISYRICGNSNRPWGTSLTTVATLSTGKCADTGSGWSPCRNECDSSMSGSVGLKTTPVDDVDDAGNLNAYPNPADLTVTVSAGSDAFAKIVSLQVVDISGRPVVSLRPSPDNIRSGSITFDVSNLSSGTYVVKCTTDSGRLTT